MGFTCLRPRIAGIVALAAVALAPAPFAQADSIQLVPSSQTLNPGQAITVSETFTNTGANANSGNGSGNGDIQLGAIDATLVNLNNANFSVSGFATSSFLASNGLTLSGTTAASGQLIVSGFESGLNGPDVALNQTVTLFSFTLTAASNLAPGTYNINLANNSSQSTDVSDINSSFLTLSPAINNGQAYNSAYDLRITIPGPSVPEPASIGMLSVAAVGLFFGRRKLRKLVG